MELSFKRGTYIEGKKNFHGEIILSEHKLFLRGPQGDWAQTYIPLEKIISIEKTHPGLKLEVTPTVTFRYTALFTGERKQMGRLLKELVIRRGLKKVFLRNRWIDNSV